MQLRPRSARLVAVAAVVVLGACGQRSDDGAEFQVMVDGGIGEGARLSQFSSKGTLTVR